MKAKRLQQFAFCSKSQGVKLVPLFVKTVAVNVLLKYKHTEKTGILSRRGKMMVGKKAKGICSHFLLVLNIHAPCCFTT